MTATLLKTFADVELSLASAVNVGATTATLSSASDEDDVALPSGMYGFTIDGDNSAKEYIICTLTSTALTSVQHISRQGAATTGFANYHRVGATVTITDWATLSRILNNLNGTTGFDSGTNLGYDGAPAGLTGNQFATVNYVLSVVSGGTVTYDQQVLALQTAGENLTIRNHIYLKESDQKWYNVDADTTTTFMGVQRGIALATVTTNNTFTAAISGPVTGFSGLTAGSKYYASGTPGAITATIPTIPTQESLVGVALTTTSLLLTLLPNTNQFAGTGGVPSSTNKFVTQDGTSASATDQSQTTQNGTSAAGEADATTKRNKLAQSFIPTKASIRGVNLYKSANTGSFTGTVTVSVQADSAGSPSGSALATKTITNAAYLAYAVGDFMVLFTSEVTVTAGNLYWIVIQTSTADNSNCINLGTNTAGGYASGTAKYNNVTDGWVLISTIDLYFKTLEGIASKVPLLNSSGQMAVSEVQQRIKIGNLTLQNSATANVVAHGLAKVPSYIEVWVGGGGSSAGWMSVGIYDVVAATYARNGFVYNEATSGGPSQGTNAVADTYSTTGGSGVDLLVSIVDENIVQFSADANTTIITYKIVA